MPEHCCRCGEDGLARECPVCHETICADCGHYNRFDGETYCEDCRRRVCEAGEWGK